MTKTRALALISAAVLFGMALWFGVSAVAPQIAREWHLSESSTAWLTLAVQLGFVAGTLISALLNLPDIISARHLMTICALAGAAANAALALGVLIGALTIGKASPYLINAIGPKNWRLNVGIASLFAIVSALMIVAFVREGPYALANQPFDIMQITRVFQNRGVRLANFGYFGHMWELYAMWTWAPVMIRASLRFSASVRFWGSSQ